MNNPCEGCQVYNICGHAGGKPDKYQCGQRYEYNLISANNAEWVAWVKKVGTFRDGYVTIDTANWQERIKALEAKE